MYARYATHQTNAVVSVRINRTVTIIVLLLFLHQGVSKCIRSHQFLFSATNTVAHLALPQRLVESLTQRDIVLSLRALEELPHLKLTRAALCRHLGLRVHGRGLGLTVHRLVLVTAASHHRSAQRVTHS